MKKLIVIIMCLISSFSYYGEVDDSGNKITNFQNLIAENTVQNEVVDNNILVEKTKE